MTQSRAGGWIAGTVVVVLVIWAGMWFFLAAPRMEQTALTMTEVESTRLQNELLLAEVERLETDFVNLEAYEAELAALHLEIPTDAQLSGYIRTLAAAADANGVVITEIAPGTPAPFAVAPPLVPVAPPVENPTEPAAEEPPTEGDTAPAAEAPAVPPGPVQIEGFVAVPLTIKVIGPYASATAFVGQLQTGSGRLFLVSGLQGTRQDELDASGGRPATAAGDVEMVVSGFLYVLRPPTTVVEPVDPAAEPVPLPASPNNPFAPLS